MTNLKKEIIQAMYDAMDTIDGKISENLFDFFLDGVLKKYTTHTTPTDSLLEKPNDIEVIGNCANCGVEYHIHKEDIKKDLIKALEMIATGEIVGEPKNYKDSIFIVKQIASEALELVYPELKENKK